MAKDAELQTFKDAVWQHFEQHGRHTLPWRIPEPDGSFDPYKILVSEIMLQQTQVPRVIPKYVSFLETFPTIDALAAAPLGSVLQAWSGLGYNRRAKYLWQAAQIIHEEHEGVFPRDQKTLIALPGVGKNTAGAILAYAFNQPIVFVETNIRTAYIFHYFKGREAVIDQEIEQLLEASLDQINPRLWYWALMDYGSHLKQTIGNLNKLSKSYAVQSPFAGSRRQIRGRVIRLLSAKPMDQAALAAKINDERLESVLNDLLLESLIHKNSKFYSLH